MRSFLLGVLVCIAAFLGYKWWGVQKTIETIERGQPVSQEASNQEMQLATIVPATSPPPVEKKRELNYSARDKDAQQNMLNDVARHIAGKGGAIIDKRVFPSVEACNNAVSGVVEEYKRRGVDVSNIVDASAMVDIRGATVISINNVTSYLYLTCFPHPQNLWAGYIQFSLTREQLEATRGQ